MSVDPQTAKYSFLSPYNYSGNNPILLVDYDGRDFGVYVNPTDKTVIIKTTIYTSSNNKADVQASAKAWTAANGKFTYDFTDADGKAQSYEVKFEITIDATSKTEVAANNKYSDDVSGVSNIARYLEDNAFDKSRPDAKNLNAYTQNAQDATVRKSRKGSTTAAHEFGHFFGLGHRNKGLPEKGETRNPTDKSISKEAVQFILSQAKLTKSADNSTDFQTESNEKNPKVRSSGITPENKGGTVNEKPKGK